MPKEIPREKIGVLLQVICLTMSFSETSDSRNSSWWGGDTRVTRLSRGPLGPLGAGASTHETAGHVPAVPPQTSSLA